MAPIREITLLSILCFAFTGSKPSNPSLDSRVYELSNQIDAFFQRFDSTINKVDSRDQCEFVKEVYQNQISDLMIQIEKTIPGSTDTKREAVAHFLSFAVTFLEHHFVYCSKKKEGVEDVQVKCETDAYPPNEVYDLPRLKLDLSVEPSQRWSEIAGTYKEQITDLINQAMHLVDLIDPTGKIVKFVDDYFPLLLVKFPQPYRDEVSSIAETTEVSVGRIIVFNIFYEIFSVCTSIVTENQNTGEHFHVRNLDFGLFLGWDFEQHTWKVSELLRKMEFNLEVVNGNQSVFNQTTFAGYVGVFTGVKANKYSVSVNERFVFGGGGGPAGLFDWIVKQEDLYFATWLVRDVLEANYTYDEAINELSTRGLIAPCYYIVSGVEHNQGHLITRSHNDSLQPVMLNLEEDRWYLLQTNYDHWNNPPFFDNRRIPGQKCMNESSAEAIDKAHLFNVLSTDPVLNQLTVFSSLMNPQTGHVEGYRRNCTECFIW